MYIDYDKGKKFVRNTSCLNMKIDKNVHIFGQNLNNSELLRTKKVFCNFPFVIRSIVRTLQW